MQKFWQFFFKQQKILRTVYPYFLVLVMLMSCVALLFSPVAQSFDTRPVTFTIRRDSNGLGVLWKLYTKGLVRNYFNARIFMAVTKAGNNIHAGRYTLNRSMSLGYIFDVISERKGLSQTATKRVVIPEGTTVVEIVDLLDAQKVVSKNALLEYLATTSQDSWREKYPFLPSADLELKGAAFFEGYLFPDTYIFAEDTTPEQVVDYMLYTFKAQAWPLLSDLQDKKYNAHKVLTMASIVEKESVNKEDRERIAGVYYNRLKKWMHLGSCPTVKYALGQPRKKDLLYRDLDVRSPYNTYRNYGLPPTPICSPSLASIKAALHPAQTEYLYFFATGNGTHQYSITLEEHISRQRKHIN